MQSAEYMYVLGDGDKIREKVEYYLLNHDSVYINLRRAKTNKNDKIVEEEDKIHG